MYSRLSHNSLRLLRLVLLGTLSSFTVLSGVVISPITQAQQPPGDMALYTRIARLIERQRMQDYAEVKQFLGGKVPEAVCQRKDMPPQVQGICDRFDGKSRDIIQANGMTVGKFNEITRFCQQSPKPKECPR